MTLKSYYKSSSGFEDGGMIQLESNEFKAATEGSDANEYWTIKNVMSDLKGVVELPGLSLQIRKWMKEDLFLQGLSYSPYVRSEEICGSQ